MTRFIVRKDHVSGSDCSFSVLVSHGDQFRQVSCGLLAMTNEDFAVFLRIVAAGANIVDGAEVSISDITPRRNYITRNQEART